jgi:hypothetical protein
MIEAWKKAQAPEPELLLLPEIFDSVRVFDAMATQWDRAGERGSRGGPQVQPVADLPAMLESRARSVRRCSTTCACSSSKR